MMRSAPSDRVVLVRSFVSLAVASFFCSALSVTPATPGSGSLGVSFNVLSTIVVRVCVTEGMTFIVPEKLPDVLGVAPAELDQVAVLAGQVMHFEHAGDLREQLAGPIRHVERTGRPDRHERQLAQADGLGIEQRRVARQDALGLQLPQPLEHRRRRQPDRTRDVSLRHPGVRLNHVQYLDVEIVKHALQLPLQRIIVGQSRRVKKIRRHMTA